MYSHRQPLSIGLPAWKVARMQLEAGDSRTAWQTIKNNYLWRPKDWQNYPLDPRDYGLGAIDPTFAFAQAVDPYTWRFRPTGPIVAPYGWGGRMTVGMPSSYAHHIGYQREPIVLGSYGRGVGVAPVLATRRRRPPRRRRRRKSRPMRALAIMPKSTVLRLPAVSSPVPAVRPVTVSATVAPPMKLAPVTTAAQALGGRYWLYPPVRIMADILPGNSIGIGNYVRGQCIVGGRVVPMRYCERPSIPSQMLGALAPLLAVL